MEQGRTGRRFRFAIPLIGVSYRAIVIVSLIFGVFAVGALVSFAALARQGLERVTDASDPLQRLRRPLSDSERAAGRVMGVGSFRGAYDPPVCFIAHQHYVSGKNGGWRDDQTAWMAESATLTIDGRTWSVDPNALRFDPHEVEVASGEFEERLRQRNAGFLEGGRLVHECVPTERPVFVDACVSDAGGVLARCADGDVTTITLGDVTPGRRIRSRAEGAAARLTAGLVALLCVAGYLWRVLRAGTLVEPLRAWTGAPPTPSRKVPVIAAIAVIVSAWIVVLLATSTADEINDPYLVGYGFGAMMLVVTALAALFLRDRRSALSLALQACERAQTSRLADVGEGDAELAVRVRPDAPTVQIPDHAPHAFVRVSIKRIVHAGRTTQTFPLHTASWPSKIPIEDASGPGILDLTGAELDLRSTFRDVRNPEAQRILAAYAQTPFGDPARGLMYTSLEIEESFLDAGEHAYLMGSIRRVHDPAVSALYREMGTVPFIRSSLPVRLVMHAGSERSLIQSLRRERAVVSAILAMLAAASMSLLAALAYLRSLA